MLKLGNRLKPIETTANDLGCVLVINRATTRDGHVQIRVDGKLVNIHRVAYEQNFGEIPQGMVVRHKCDIPNCVNPEHLELGTHADNVRDRKNRKRSAKGGTNGRSKLTEDDVRFIREDTTYTDRELADKFGVNHKAIKEVKRFNTWKHVK